MGFTVQQKIEICLHAEANPQMTQMNLAQWVRQNYGLARAPCQTTISRILSSKAELIASMTPDLRLVRRRKRTNPVLRRILTEWMTQGVWEKHPMPTAIITLVASSIWNRLPAQLKEGTGEFNGKWINNFVKRLNIDVDEMDMGYPLNKVWELEEKVELKQYLQNLIALEGYQPQDIFCIEEFSLFYSLPLDQIFDVSSIDLGLKQADAPAERSLTIMLSCNLDGLEKFEPLVVGKYEKFDVFKHPRFTLGAYQSNRQILNKINQEFGIQYSSNVNKWITSLMFHKYLLLLHQKLKAANRKIVIILDDSSSHRIINLKFSHIRLIYLKNNSNLKFPNYADHGVKYDYLPLNYGIIEEFRIRYRIQQYQWMINIQQSRYHNRLEVLSEKDYKIPLVNVLEWISYAWSQVQPSKIQTAWRRTHLFPMNYWSANQIATLPAYNDLTDEQSGYHTLVRLISQLNVVIPWEIDELVGLVNERGKVTLMYTSIEEIIDSCLSETLDYEEFLQMDEPNDMEWFSTNDVMEKPPVKRQTLADRQSSNHSYTPSLKSASTTPSFKAPEKPLTPASPCENVQSSVLKVLDLANGNYLNLRPETILDLEQALVRHEMA